MSRADFKIMFVHINDRMRTFIPLNISLLSGALKKAGFSTALFDTSFYIEQPRVGEEQKKVEAGIYQAVDYASIGVVMKEGSIEADLMEAIGREQPGLIAFSVFTQAWEDNERLAQRAKEVFPSIPIVFGGIHINIESGQVLSRPFIDYICVGEGEQAVVDLADALHLGESVQGIPNIGWKDGDTQRINPPRPLAHMDTLPFPDWDLFSPVHQYGPFHGRMWRLGLVEYTRTCPYSCAYCGNDIFKDRYRESGHKIRYRFKTPRVWIDELKRMKEQYGTEMFYVSDGTFLAQNTRNFTELA
ncbi:MAG: cobalamin-dependent protein, partial [Magnetococcales bacterium]|nr:cobalamin-dependent protein [Magnetococcales bacterium]